MRALLWSWIALSLVAHAGPPAKITLGAPGLSYVNLPADQGNLFLNQFAAEVEKLGPRVITAQQIATLLGNERQKAILGCGDDQSAQCMIELANAVGVDGLITGSLGRFGSSYQLTLVVVSARDGSMLGSYSGSADSDRALFEMLGVAARVIGPQVGKKLGRPVLTFPKNTLSINPIAPALTLGTVLNLEYEHALTEHWSAFVAPEFFTGLSRDRTVSGSLMVLAAGARWFPTGPAPAGFFVGARLHMLQGFLGSSSIVTQGPGLPDFSGASVSLVGLGGETGFSWTFFQALYLSLGVGLNVDMYQSFLIHDPNARVNLGVVPLPLARINVGWAF